MVFTQEFEKLEQLTDKAYELLIPSIIRPAVTKTQRALNFFKNGFYTELNRTATKYHSKPLEWTIGSEIGKQFNRIALPFIVGGLTAKMAYKVAVNKGMGIQLVPQKLEINPLTQALQVETTSYREIVQISAELFHSHNFAELVSALNYVSQQYPLTRT
ncbi:MAG: hypothetical protein V1837_01385 [Candidatus Woesearchaeota archaeon]